MIPVVQVGASLVLAVLVMLLTMCLGVVLFDYSPEQRRERRSGLVLLVWIILALCLGLTAVWL